jgi:hypothetical protein
MMSRIALSTLALLLAGGCSGSEAVGPGPRGRGPSLPDGVASLSRSAPRSGELHVTKECSQYTRLAGGFCTITSSNLDQIEVGTKVVYTTASGPTVLDTDITLVLPHPGRSRAFGHCRLDLASGIGLCTFSGGTGRFKEFNARADVSSLGRPNWAWNGTYSFR